MRTWILSSSVLILAVLAIRALAGERISARIRYALWLLVLVRLLVPVNFARSAISVENLIPEGEIIVTEAMEFPAAEAPVAGTAAVPEVRDTVDAGAVLTLVWLGGTAAVLGFTAVSNALFRRTLRAERRALEACACPVPVYAAEGLTAPCLVGVFAPAVYVPEAAAEGKTLRHVLAHEVTHLHHFDHVFSVLRCLVLAVHWFNPLVWLAVWASKDDAELACDEGAVELLGDGDRESYGRTLIRLSCSVKKGGTIMIGVNAMTGRKKALRRRIEGIAGRRRTAVSAVVLVLVLSLLAAGCTFTGAESTNRPVETTAPPAAAGEEPTETEPGSYDVMKEYLKDFIGPEEEAMVRQMLRFAGQSDEGDEAEAFIENMKRIMLSVRMYHDADDVLLQSITELTDTQPGRDSLQVMQIEFQLTKDGEVFSDVMYMRHWDECSWNLTVTLSDEDDARFQVPGV